MYAVCTVTRAETMDRIDRFPHEEAAAALEVALPGVHRTGGMGVAALCRHDA